MVLQKLGIEDARGGDEETERVGLVRHARAFATPPYFAAASGRRYEGPCVALAKQGSGRGYGRAGGNVWEWCEDWYGAYASGAATDPKGPSSRSARCLRGGGVGILRSSGRSRLAPTVRGRVLGLRVALRS
ncbi:MAG: SUMF1/EgtB/PvdO family nonheme iron enzyme [Planctomycetes bacterium]|nr:SUMF1/EgtB/PvdO family nonheme iron enzyme [Planctomycetota bacterium]